MPSHFNYLSGFTTVVTTAKHSRGTFITSVLKPHPRDAAILLRVGTVPLRKGEVLKGNRELASDAN
jgi:hypothetical protein